jgi:hypothetical protein
MRRLTRWFSLGGLSLLLMAGCAGYYAETDPPASQVEVRVAAPGPNFFWVEGYWRWSSRQYMWVPGHWERSRPRRVYNPGRWERNERGWRWHNGQWRHE